MDEDFPYGQLPPPPAVTLTPPDTMPQQPSQAIAPQGGIPPMPNAGAMPDEFSTATNILSKNPDYQMGADLAKKVHDKAMGVKKAADAIQGDGSAEDLTTTTGINNALIRTNQVLSTLKPAAFSFIPGANSKNRQAYQSQLQQANIQRELLTKLADMAQNGDEEDIKALGELHKRVSEWTDTAKEVGAMQRSKAVDARMKQFHNDLTNQRGIQNQLAEQRIGLSAQLQPYHIQALQALAQGRQLSNDQHRALAPIIQRLQQAKLSNQQISPALKMLGILTAQESATGEDQSPVFDQIMQNPDLLNALSGIGMQPQTAPPSRAPFTLRARTSQIAPAAPAGLPAQPGAPNYGTMPGIVPNAPPAQNLQSPPPAIGGAVGAAPVLSTRLSPKGELTAKRDESVNTVNNQREIQLRYKNAESARQQREDAEFEANSKGISVDELVRRHPSDYPALSAGKSQAAPGLQETIASLRKRLGRQPTVEEVRAEVNK